MGLPLPATLRVGVTGHRPNKLSTDEIERLTREVRRLLADLRSVVDGNSRLCAPAPAGSAVFQIVSPLAEGADRIVARLGLEQGAELIALLPFARSEYMLDFSTRESRDEFLELLGKAHEIVEMDGRRDGEKRKNQAYGRVGALVVERSDVLIALWDGDKASGAGGTAQVIDLARRSRTPVLWFPTSNGSGAAISNVPRLLLGDDITTANAAEAFLNLAGGALAQQP